MMFEGEGTADPAGYCMFIDGVMYPIYGQTLINGYKLATGEARDSIVNIYMPQEIEIAYRDPNDNEIKFLDVNKMPCKVFSLIDARVYYWWWMYVFWYYMLHQGKDYQISEEIFWKDIEKNLNSDHDISFITMWARRRPHRDVLWKKISPIINEYCKYHAGEKLNVYKIVKWYSERELCPEFYPRVLIDFVTETDENVIFLTEKTFRPIVYGKIPLIYAAPKTYQRLFMCGYTPHPEIDYSFDRVIDNEKRGEMIIEQLDNLINTYEVSELSDITREIRLKNFEWAFNFAKTDTGPPPFPKHIPRPWPTMIESVFLIHEKFKEMEIPEGLILER